jgi:tRNA (guanine-N7-)-methyltransferase
MLQELRPVKSFVRREGRLTQGQMNALKNFWERYGINPVSVQKLVLDHEFDRTAPVWLEIGCGNGEALVDLAMRYPEINFLGIDVYRPGIGHLLLKASEQRLSNLKVILDDAVSVLRTHIVDQSLDRVLLFFPDPWPKKRHQKRRIVQPEFVRLIHQRLKPQGIFHLATDWEDYAHQMLRVMSSTDGFVNLAKERQFSKRPVDRPVTRFERRGQKLGHSIWDLVFQRG